MLEGSIIVRWAGQPPDQRNALAISVAVSLFDRCGCRKAVFAALIWAVGFLDMLRNAATSQLEEHRVFIRLASGAFIVAEWWCRMPDIGSGAWLQGRWRSVRRWRPHIRAHRPDGLRIPATRMLRRSIEVDVRKTTLETLPCRCARRKLEII